MLLQQAVVLYTQTCAFVSSRQDTGTEYRILICRICSFSGTFEVSGL